MRILRAGALLVPIALAAIGWLAAPSSVDAQTSCRHVRVRSPFTNDAVRGVVPILGSARIDDFGFYKLEWAHVTSPESWSAVSTTIADPVVNGRLDTWNTTRVADGTYRLKLTAVDSIGQEPCRAYVERLNVTNTTAITPTATAESDVPFAPPVSGTPVDAETAVAAGDVPADATEVATTSSESSDVGSSDEDAVGENDAAAVDASATEAAADEDVDPGEEPLDATSGTSDEDEGAAAESSADGIALFEPMSWPSALGLSALPVAFFGGMLLAVGVALLGVAIYVLRAR